MLAELLAGKMGIGDCCGPELLGPPQTLALPGPPCPALDREESLPLFPQTYRSCPLSAPLPLWLSNVGVAGCWAPSRRCWVPPPTRPHCRCPGGWVSASQSLQVRGADEGIPGLRARAEAAALGCTARVQAAPTAPCGWLPARCASSLGAQELWPLNQSPKETGDPAPRPSSAPVGVRTKLPAPLPGHSEPPATLARSPAPGPAGWPSGAAGFLKRGEGGAARCRRVPAAGLPTIFGGDDGPHTLSNGGLVCRARARPTAGDSHPRRVRHRPPRLPSEGGGAAPRELPDWSPLAAGLRDRAAPTSRSGRGSRAWGARGG